MEVSDGHEAVAAIEGEAQKSKKEELSRRTTRPGIKRLCLVLSILLSFVFGLPFWLKSTEIFRTSLPFTTIEAHTAHVTSSSLIFPCYFHFLFTREKDLDSSDQSTMQALEESVLTLSKLMHNRIRGHNTSSGCHSSYTLMASLDSRDKCLQFGVPEGVPVWPCGLAKSTLFDLVVDQGDQVVDEFLSNYSGGSGIAGFTNHSGEQVSRGGLYTILSVDSLWGGISEYAFEKQKQMIGSVHSGHASEVLQFKARAVIGKYRHAWIIGSHRDSLAVDAELELMSEIAVRYFMDGGSNEQQSKISNEERGEAMPLAADGKAILSFSLLNAEPNDWIFDWDFEALEKQFLSPVVRALRPIAHLTIESQILYYTPNAVRSFWDQKLQKHVVYSKDLPFFVNANEWHLDTSSAAAGRSKVLHFAIYVPAVIECPLQLKYPDGMLSSTNGFTSPSWGGVIIWNPSTCNKSSKTLFHHLAVEDLEPVMQVIIAQIRTLFGLPSVPFMDVEQGIVCLPASDTGFSEWELDVMLRRRAAADVVSFASTLRSLSRLVQSLPNMVIMEEIGDQVRSSLLAATAAEGNASQGSYTMAADAAQKARALAEEAFFQPSIMSLLYLPLEHHFAIYTPFFVPVLLHTILAAVKEIRRYKREHQSFQLCVHTTDT